MIPDFEDNGNLPPGIHYCFWDEFKERFGYTDKRRRMISNMETIMLELQAAGYRTFYVKKNKNSFGVKALLGMTFSSCKNLLTYHFPVLARSCQSPFHSMNVRKLYA